MDELEKELAGLRERIERLEKAVFDHRQTNHPRTPEIDFDLNALGYVKHLNSTLDKCLAILNYAFEKDHTLRGFTPDELERILRETFGIPIPAKSISNRLGEVTGELVSRELFKGKTEKYRYRILQAGQREIQKRIKELRGQTNASES